MDNVIFNIVNSDNEVLHSFVKEENANTYVELRKSINEEYLDVEEKEVIENLDLKIVEVVTLTANLHLNQTIKIYMNIEKMINIDASESANSFPIFLGGIYEYKVVRILPELKSEQDKFIEDLKIEINNEIIKKYDNYVKSNNLKNIFSFSSEEIALINKRSTLYKEVCEMNNKFVEDLNDKDLQFELFGCSNLLDRISVLEKIANDTMLNKYQDYKELMKEYHTFQSKYKFKS